MREGSIPDCAEHRKLTELGTEANIKYPSSLPLISRLCHLLINKEPQCFYMLLIEAGGLGRAQSAENAKNSPETPQHPLPLGSVCY